KVDRRLVVGALLLLAAICIAYYLLAARPLAAPSGLPLDYTFIHLQFSKSLAHGDGLAFRQGKLVSGSTAPLWTAVLSLLFALPGPLLVWVKLLGALLYVAGAAATWWLARELGSKPATAVAVVVLFLLTDALVWSALSGMEVGLFVALSVAGVALHLRERAAVATQHPSLAIALFGLASLARPEGLLLLALAILDRVMFPAPGTSRRGALSGVAVGAIAAAATIVAFQI